MKNNVTLYATPITNMVTFNSNESYAGTVGVFYNANGFSESTKSTDILELLNNESKIAKETHKTNAYNTVEQIKSSTSKDKKDLITTLYNKSISLNDLHPKTTPLKKSYIDGTYDTNFNNYNTMVIQEIEKPQVPNVYKRKKHNKKTEIYASLPIKILKHKFSSDKPITTKCVKKPNTYTETHKNTEKDKKTKCSSVKIQNMYNNILKYLSNISYNSYNNHPKIYNEFTEDIKNENILVSSWVRWDKNNYKVIPLNWGDDLNYYFLQELTLKRHIPFVRHHVVKNDVILDDMIDSMDNYLLIGSVITDMFVDDNTIIWGSGIMSENKSLPTSVKSVKAVRGPLTRKLLLEQGILCPEIYGDPALLLPYYYNPAIHKKYKLGIIPHHKTLKNPILSNFNSDDVLIIDLVHYTHWLQIINQILSCDFIVSESLHGLIVSEAYHVPNAWIKIDLSNQEMKFHDFFLSIGQDRTDAYNITDTTTIQDLLDLKNKYIPSKPVNVYPLIKSCPFKLHNITYPAVIKPATEKVAICCIGKMENNYIREFVEYHKNIGIDNIILYDNNDIDGEHFEEVIEDYIKSGYVILKDYRGKFQAQIQSYTECYNEYKDLYDWIAFIDIDEFIEIDDKFNNIHHFLNLPKFNIRGINAIRLCWKQYTDSNIIKVENNDYSIKRFTEYRPLTEKYTSNTTKIILRTSINNVEFSSPHGPLLDKRIKCVNTKGEECINAISIKNLTWDNAKLNHYRFRTIHEYVMNKMVRLWPTHYGNGGKEKLNLLFFFEYNTFTKEKYEYAKYLIKKYNISENIKQED